MKKTISLTLVLGALTVASSVQAQPRYIELFNGRNLNNWSGVLSKPGVTMEDVFIVTNGVILCKGDPLGYIQTDRAFTNFLLEVEWRWKPGTKPGNSGVFLRINGQPRPLPRCIECQLKSGDAGDLYGFHGMGIDGEASRKITKKGHELGGDFTGVKKLFANENRAGQWNRLEIELIWRELSISVNGRQVNQANHCELTGGPIGLQSEGGEIEFRKVRLTPR